MKNGFNRKTSALQVSFLLIVAQLALILVVWRRLPPEVPLFYSRPWGENQLAQAYWLLILPALSVAVTTGNLLAGKLMEGKAEKAGLAVKILTFFSPVFDSLCLYTLIRIIWMVS